jgi:hypothetical protein
MFTYYAEVILAATRLNFLLFWCLNYFHICVQDEFIKSITVFVYVCVNS